KARWSKAVPILRRWVEDNRDAMELYRQGSDRPDALGPYGSIHLNSHDLVIALSTFKELALLEASRLEDEGDLAGAWTWYRAALRAAHHLGQRGTMFDRRVAVLWQGEIRGRVDAWAADRRTTPAMLRRALDDAIACESLAPSETYSLWVDYG